MDNEIENIKNGEHKLIWQKLETLEKYVVNDVRSRLDKLNGRQWKLIFAMLTILGGLCIALILAMLKILS